MKLWKKLTAAVLMSAAMLGAGLTAKPLLPVLTGAEITASAFRQGDLTFSVGSSYAEVLSCSSDAVSVTIPSYVEGVPVTRIGLRAFGYQCSKLTEVYIPATVTYIGEEAFAYCTGLTGIRLPDSVTSIDEKAFEGCTGLTEITIPDSVSNLGDMAFMDCTSLKSVTLPDSITAISSYLFSSCTALTDITIPHSVTTIGGNAFGRCNSLTTITIPNSVTKIDYEAFASCTGLKNITIPDSVTYLGAGAFDGCTALKSFVVMGSDTQFADGLNFYYCDNMTMYGFSGSEAEKYAKKYGIPFELISDMQITAVTLSKTAFPYTGKEIKVGIYIRVKSGTTALKYGTDFTMTYANNVKCGIGTASVTIKGIGNYTGTVTKYYSILPAKQAKPALSTLNGKLHVEWSADANGQGYQVQYCKDASFTGDTLYSVSFASKTACNLVTYPKAGETWYVRVRSYLKNSAGTKHGYWSDAACITLGKIDNVTLTQTEFAYTGNAVKVGTFIRVKSGTTALKYGKDFELVYHNNIKKGTASVTAKGIGAYAGSEVTVNYHIR